MAGGDRFAQLGQRDPFAGQLLEQPEPGLARRPLEVVEQPLGRVVDVSPAGDGSILTERSSFGGLFQPSDERRSGVGDGAAAARIAAAAEGAAAR
ncbi:MAG TPA: hypothetical protein VIJ21_11210, partial [Solirubrobacterales bacterium]